MACGLVRESSRAPPGARAAPEKGSAARGGSRLRDDARRNHTSRSCRANARAARIGARFHHGNGQAAPALHSQDRMSQTELTLDAATSITDLVDGPAEVEDTRTTFAELGLDASVLQAVADAGYVHPTPIQQRAIPLILRGRDVMGLAQTGTGKTAAFTLPVVARLAGGPRRTR